MPPTLSTLPPELLSQILAHLPSPSRSTFSQTCTPLRHAYICFLQHTLDSLPPTSRAYGIEIAERGIGIACDGKSMGLYLVLKRVVEDYDLVSTLARCVRAR